MRGVSERTIQRNWEKGRLYLHHAIGGADPTADERPCRLSTLIGGASSARTWTRRWRSRRTTRAGVAGVHLRA